MPPPTKSRSLGCLRHLIAGRSSRSHRSPESEQADHWRAHEFSGWIGLAEVAHRAIVGDPGAAVRPEPHVGRTIERVSAATYKGLIDGLVIASANLELKRLTNFGKVKELDLMTDFRIPFPSRNRNRPPMHRAQRHAAPALGQKNLARSRCR